MFKPIFISLVFFCLTVASKFCVAQQHKSVNVLLKEAYPKKIDSIQKHYSRLKYYNKVKFIYSTKERVNGSATKLGYVNFALDLLQKKEHANSNVDSTNKLYTQVIYEKAYLSLYSGDYDTCIKYSKDAFARFIQDDKPCKAANALLNISDAFSFLGITDSVFFHIKKCKKLCKEKGCTKELIYCLNQLGIYSNKKGNIQESIDYFFKAKSIAEENNDSINIANGLMNIGNIYLSQKKYDLAAENFIESKNIFKSIKVMRGVSVTLQRLSSLYRSTNQLEKSNKYVKESIAIAEEYEDKHTLSAALDGLANNCNELNKNKEALTYYLKSLKIKKELKVISGIAHGFINVGELYGELKEYDKAIQYGLKGIKYARRSKELDEVCNGYSLLHKSYEEKGDKLKAYDAFKIYVRVKDSLLNVEIVNRTAEKQAQFDYSKKAFQDSLEQQQVLALKQSEIEAQKADSRSMIILISSILGVLLLGGLFYYLYQKNNSEKKILSLRNQALRLQINPHFFFNAMNSINKYIGNNEPLLAKSYLTKFSKVMRLSLESVQEDVVPLQQEIDFLTNYIEIEKLQHKNFDYKIIVDDNIDTEEIVMPPILIQPYIENSILHGFVDKTIEQKGELAITFKLNNGKLNVQVKDDGVGMVKTTELKVQSINHKSLALSITQKRLNAFAKKKIEVKFFTPENGGTLISFNLPIIELA